MLNAQSSPSFEPFHSISIHFFACCDVAFKIPPYPHPGARTIPQAAGEKPTFDPYTGIGVFSGYIPTSALFTCSRDGRWEVPAGLEVT